MCSDHTWRGMQFIHHITNTKRTYSPASKPDHAPFGDDTSAECRGGALSGMRGIGNIHQADTPLIAAVIATCNRPVLLARRSLKSIVAQSRPPDMLIVVDDSDHPEVRYHNKTIVEQLGMAGIKSTYMENRRTRGAAGAWNTALAHLQGVAPSTFVAILDDDDSWEPQYLDACAMAASRHVLDMVAAGITYHKPTIREYQMLDPPDQLVVGDLLVRNTHIQGSNMFVRLCKLLEAGGFDEALSSTTDRDICIRLADLGTVRYGSLHGRHLVHHYADIDRPRMSTAGSDAKRAGLAYFFRKYHGRMSRDERDGFIRRSRTLFHCDPTRESLITSAPPPDFGGAGGRLDLVVGVITSPDVSLVSRLLDSLARRFHGCNDVSLRVVLLENGGSRRDARDALYNVVARASKLDITLKTLEQQAKDAAAFHISTERLDGQKSIALSRTILQHYLYVEASSRADVVVWILDDDLVLEGLKYGRDGSLIPHDVDYISGIRYLREIGADIVLCQGTGDSPVPAPSCIRTQLVDLYHNLLRISNMRPDDQYVSLPDHNRASRAARRDYYYDLSDTETDRLETPFWYETKQSGLTVAQAFEEMVSRLPDILGGICVFRPLVCGESGGTTLMAVPSVRRGPATILFDVSALRDFPNVVPAVDGANIRRSDMVWSLLNRFVAGRHIVQSQLPVRHIRETAGTHPNFESLLGDMCGRDPKIPSKMIQDIRGYAFYSAMSDVLEGKARRSDGILVHFSQRDIRDTVESYRKHIRERARAFELNYIRIMGILSALRRICQPNQTYTVWWLDSLECAAPAAKLRGFVESLGSIYTDERLDEFRRGIADVGAGDVERFLADLPRIIYKYRAGTPLPVDALRHDAYTHVTSEFATGPLTYLGMGEEGVVLTDGRLAYKHFHRWGVGKRRMEFLSSVAGRLSGYDTLPHLMEVRRRNNHVVAVYPYHSGVVYTGGHLEGVLTILRECRRAGIACRNIHPDNLLVTASGLKLVDYGADVVPVDGREFEQMCRRAFLSYRFAAHHNLKFLMGRATHDDTMAELAGLEQFRNALDPRELDCIFYRPLARLVAGVRPASVLDYGCGKGRLATRLVQMGVKVTGYDPDSTCIKACQSRGERATYGGKNLRARLLAASARFDVIVCSQVLCTIQDNSEMECVLRDLRCMVADSGTVIVTVCNPFYLATASTELVRRHLPERSRYGETFPYTKTVTATGNQRTEVHRSCDIYRRAFAKAGLFVRDVTETDGTDTLSVLPASEHLVFRLCPTPLGGPTVSLMIATRPAEWRSVERVVEHYVAQLEGPRTFAEKVVVVDMREGPSPLQPECVAHRDIMERLLRDGTIDHIVYVTPDMVRSTRDAWFGAEPVYGGSTDGRQSPAAVMFGLDSCTGDYILYVGGGDDVVIVRENHARDYIANMADALRRDSGALFLPVGTCGGAHTFGGQDGCVRLYDRRRLLSALFTCGKSKNERFAPARRHDSGGFMAGYSCRSHVDDTMIWFVRVPDNCKASVEEWCDMLCGAERGYIPDVCVDLVGTTCDWAGPRRSEPFVFVVCGHDVDPGRLKRCCHSMTSQYGVEWGAVVVDDASTNGFGDYARILLADYMDRITLVRNQRYRGISYNVWSAATHVCTDPDTVMILLDADGALTGNRVLERVRVEYDDGADATVGSTLYPGGEDIDVANLENPRRPDSNVWHHMGTFKKRLIDAIPMGDFKMDGEWIDHAAAFMVPVIEMATNPRFIPDKLHLYEPAIPADDGMIQERDRAVWRIISRM